MDTDDLSLDWEPGVRAEIDRGIGGGRKMSLSAFG
jgi:hypothetical protein